MPELDSCLYSGHAGAHGLNEESSRHRWRNGRTECILCGDKCESVVHVSWECPAKIIGKGL